MVAVLLIAGSLSLFKTNFAHKVDVETVAIDTAIDAVPAIVNVRSDYTFTLSSEENGRVIRSSLVLGGNIEQGEPILQIDPTDLEIDISILKAEIENLISRLALKTNEVNALKVQEEDLANFERLYKAGSYPELEILRRRRDFKVFKETQELSRLTEAQELDSMQSQLKRLERRLEKTTIYAPTDGIVTTIYAYPGELISGGSPLAEVFSKALVVEAKINEEDFAGIKQGLPVTVRLLTYGNLLFKGTIRRVLPTADKENQQYTALLDIEIDPEKLLPGLSGEASIIRRRIPETIVVPRRALMGNFVFSIQNGKAVLSPVEVGVRGLNQVEIKEGLAEGDLIITDGMNSLKDGDPVRY